MLRSDWVFLTSFLRRHVEAPMRGYPTFLFELARLLGLTGARKRPALETQLDANSFGCPVPPALSSPQFTPDALHATTLVPIYPGLGQAQNMLACIPHGLVFG